MMNILAIGAGLTGCHFASEARGRGHKVVVYDISPNEAYVRHVAGDVTVLRGDVRDIPALAGVMRDHAIDAVFLNAGLIGGKAEQRPFLTLDININGAINAAEAAGLSGVKRFVFASTFGVYDYDLEPVEPIAEDFPMGGDNFYHASKTSCERILGAYSKRYGFDLACLRFARVYGLGHYAGGSGGGQAMHNAVAAAVAGKPARIDPKILAKSEYVYAKDVAYGVALACEKPLKNRAFNIGTGVMVTPEDMVGAIKEAVPGADVEIVGEAGLHHGDQPLDISRASSELGYEPRFQLFAGVADFVSELRRS
jgi:nucleoside-diphosphate-sugar epimerase